MDKEEIFSAPTAIVEEGAKVGKRTRIWHHSQIRSCAVIGEDCNIGKDVYIDSKARIGNKVKIQNGVSVYNGCIVEDEVLLGPHCVTTNDLFPRALNDNFTVIPTLFKKGCTIGAGAVVICGVVIGEHSMVGAGTVVNKDVPPHALVVGNPARVIGFVCECGNKVVKPIKKGSEYEFKCKCGKHFSVSEKSYSLLK